MISFDVQSLFNDVLFDQTINITLKRNYDDNESRISILRNEMKELLLLCMIKVHFTFNGKVDSVAMGNSFSRYIYDRVGKDNIIMY